jgi:hypothetical protein
MKLQDAAIRDAILVYISEQVPEAGAKRNILFVCCYGLHHLPAPFSEMYRTKKPGAVISSEDISAARLSQ